MRRAIFALGIFLPGLSGFLFFCHFTWIDYIALQKAYQSFSMLAESSASLEKLFVAEAQQNIHRINVFADGVWALLSAIFGAIGLHGILMSPRQARRV